MAGRLISQKQLMGGLNGSATFLGRIVAGTGAKDNSDTSGTPFTIRAGDLLLIYASAAVYVLGGVTAASHTVKADGSANTGIPLAAGEKFYMWLKTSEAYLQAITGTSTSNVDVWRME